MSDLPSRDVARDDFIDLGARSGPVEQIVRAYASGRLVDRDAIDYEAGAALHHNAPGWGYTGPFDGWLMDNVRQIVDAAIANGVSTVATVPIPIYKWAPGTYLIVEPDGTIRKLERADWDDD